jgi:hypothetical protein
MNGKREEKKSSRKKEEERSFTHEHERREGKDVWVVVFVD